MTLRICVHCPLSAVQFAYSHTTSSMYLHASFLKLNYYRVLSCNQLANSDWRSTTARDRSDQLFISWFVELIIPRIDAHTNFARSSRSASLYTHVHYTGFAIGNFCMYSICTYECAYWITFVESRLFELRFLQLLIDSAINRPLLSSAVTMYVDTFTEWLGYVVNASLTVWPLCPS
jgi:hypothetical protein